MRIASSVTSVSWIPSEAVTGTMKAPMLLGLTHYDDPPPERLDDLAGMHAAGRFRFANRLAAWIDVDEHGEVRDAGYTGGGLIATTDLRLGTRTVRLPPLPWPDIRDEPEIGLDAVRFVQTSGGRTNAPMPRRISRPPYVMVASPPVWTTLALTIRTDGSAAFEVLGATRFPRHWIYGPDGTLAQKSGLADYRSWAGDTSAEHSPWAQHDQRVLIADAETALERELSTLIMRRGSRPRLRKVAAGEAVTRQGEPGGELYLVLDGMLAVEVDDAAVAEVGPGAIVGERALLDGGRRTATLRALTPCRLAVAAAGEIDRSALVELSRGHHREDAMRV